MNRRIVIAAVVAVLVVLGTGAVSARTDGSDPGAGDPPGDKALAAAGDVTAQVPGDGSVYVPITPCRVVDTRAGGGGIFGPNQQRTYQVWGGGPWFALQGGKPNGCGIDASAIAVEATVTAVSPTAAGFFRAWPTGISMPNATFLNYGRGLNISNTGAISLSDEFQFDLTVRNFGASTHYVIDVQGFYSNIGQPVG